MALSQPRAQTLDVGGQELVYREWGDPSAPTLVYWPGMNPFTALELLEAGPAWADDGFHVIAFSGPGLGEAARLKSVEDYLPTRLASLITGALDAFAIDRAVFVGFSWGAKIGVHLAATAPGRLSALVLLDGGYDDPQDDPSFSELSLEAIEAEVEAQHERFRFPNWNAFIEAMAARPGWRPALKQRFCAGMREVDNEIVPRAEASVAATVRYTLALEPTAPALPAVAGSGVPVLLLVSKEFIDEEPWARTSLERFRAELPSASIESIAAGHGLLVEAPSLTIELVAEWLRGITAW